MSTDKPMSEHLSEIAATDAPAPDPAFVEQLDARLRVQHGASSVEPGQRLRWVPALAAATILVFGLIGTIALRRQGETAVVMTVASDTSVYFDDGPVPGSAGLVLPDGTRIVVGTDGEAVVNGVVLAPGSEAIVVDAQVALVVSGDDQDRTDLDRTTTTVASEDEEADQRSLPPSTRPASSESTTTRAPADNERPDVSSASTTVGSDSGADRSTPDDDAGSTSTQPTERTRPTSTQPAATSTSSPTSRPSATTTTATRTTTTAPATRISLTATDVGDDRLRLDWVIEGDVEPLGWRIRVGQGDRQATILVIRGGDARSATLERTAIVGRRLWIEAVGPSGETLMSSNELSIG